MFEKSRTFIKANAFHLGIGFPDELEELNQAEAELIRLRAEVERMKPQAKKQEPMKVNIEKWIYTVCPSCGEDLSVHHGDGYYSIENYVKWCPECGQMLDWGRKQKDGGKVEG